jgi:hypothetical protein
LMSKTNTDMDTAISPCLHSKMAVYVQSIMGTSLIIASCL